MIKFEDGEIIDILPSMYRSDPKVRATSYAIKKQMNQLIGFSKLASVYAVIDNLPEDMLDLLALEMRSQFYDGSMKVNVKREILKRTIIWYQNAGTPAAVQELVEAVFGVGEVQEWFQYGGEPYRFKVITDSSASSESIEEFEKIISKVKNTRSHLEKVEFIRKQEIPVHMAIVNIAGTYAFVGWEEEQDGKLQ